MDTSIFTLVVTFILIGGTIYLFFELKHFLEDLKSRINGIWTNGDESLKVLIYSIDSVFQGSVIWTAQSNSKALGTIILRDFKIKFFILGNGTYTDPNTNRKYHFSMRIVGKDIMHFWLVDDSGVQVTNEQWRLVKG